MRRSVTTPTSTGSAAQQGSHDTNRSRIHKLPYTVSPYHTGTSTPAHRHPNSLQHQLTVCHTSHASPLSSPPTPFRKPPRALPSQGPCLPASHGHLPTTLSTVPTRRLTPPRPPAPPYVPPAASVAPPHAPPRLTRCSRSSPPAGARTCTPCGRSTAPCSPGSTASTWGGGQWGMSMSTAGQCLCAAAGSCSMNTVRPSTGGRQVVPLFGLLAAQPVPGWSSRARPRGKRSGWHMGGARRRCLVSAGRYVGKPGYGPCVQEALTGHLHHRTCRLLGTGHHRPKQSTRTSPTPGRDPWLPHLKQPLTQPYVRPQYARAPTAGGPTRRPPMPVASCGVRPQLHIRYPPPPEASLHAAPARPAAGVLLVDVDDHVVEARGAAAELQGVEVVDEVGPAQGEERGRGPMG